MTNQEFSNEFDVLYNNIMSNQAPGLDEYEKSIFLTKAQDEIVKNYFNPKGNKYQEGFDGSAKRQIDFSMLIETESHTVGGTLDSGVFAPNGYKLILNYAVEISKVLFILNEYVTVTRKITYSNIASEETKKIDLTVVPIRYDEYARLMSKPYKRPLKWQAWRVFSNNKNGAVFDLVVGPTDRIEAYHIRYVKKPQAIILTNLDEDLTIGGKSKAQPCELDPILHQEILQRAVELAKAAYTGDLKSSVELGQRSE